MGDGPDTLVRQTPDEPLPAEAGFVLEGKFAAARKRVRGVILAKGWALVVLGACVCFGVSILLDRLLFLGSPYRLALLMACIATMASFMAAYLVVPLARRIPARRIARTVEEKYPELEDLLLSSVELSEQLACGETYTSRELMGAVAEETAKKTRRIDFRSAIPFSAVRKPLLMALGVACALGAYWHFRPMVTANVLQRLLYPYSGPGPLTLTEVTVLPGDGLVPRASDVEIRAITRGKIPEKAILYLNTAQAGWDKVRMTREKTPEHATKETRKFRYVLKGVLNPFRYRVKAGDARSGTFTISVSDRPVIVEIEAVCTYPEYTGRKEPYVSRGGDIAVVRGSRVRISARANKPLKNAKLKFQDGTESLLSIRWSVVQSQELEVIQDESYSFELQDTDDFSSPPSGGVIYRIQAVEDKAPVVGITSPERYSRARIDDFVSVRFRAVDDFGIEKAWLEYTVGSAELKEEKDKVAEERKGVLPTPARGTLRLSVGGVGRTEVEGEFALSIGELPVKEGEVLTFRIVAEDNNVLSGPGKGASSEHTIRIISEEASFERIEREQQNLARRLARLIGQQKENKKLVDELRSALAGKTGDEKISEAESGSVPPRLDLGVGQSSAAARNRLERAKSVQRQIEEAGLELARDFGATLEEMRLNPMIQPRTIIGMGEVSKSLTGVSRNEMPEATQKATEAATSKESRERDSRLVETSAVQEKIIEKLEEVSEEFAKLQEEQRMLALGETARKLAGEQLQARTQTAAALPELGGLFLEKLTEEQKRRLKKLVEEQEKLKEKLTEFEERLRALSKQSEYARSRDAQMLASALKYFEKGDTTSPGNIPGDVSEAIESLRANHLHKGFHLQGRVYESLLKLAEEFQKAQMVNLQGEFTNAEQGLEFQQPEIDKLIEIQKGIISETESLPQETKGEAVEGREIGKFGKVSESQKELLRRTSNFRAIIEEIFENLVMVEIDPVTPLKGAEEAMGKATGSLEKLQAGGALGEEKDSLKKLEKAREELAKALARAMASSSLRQAMQGMSALEKMIVEQKKVNEGTISLDKEAADKAMSDPMLETLRQLANRQAGLRDRAIAMRNYLKMMVKAGEMMGQSVQRLNDRQTGQDTQQLQSQILELLVQMLVRLRAEANAMAQAMGLPGTSGTGARGGVATEPIGRPVPNVLDDRWANLPPRMKQELLEAWTEKFSPEFRELIALYYKRLAGEDSPAPAVKE